MSFGNGYEPREYNQFVPEGDYTIRLGMGQDVEKSGYHMRETPIQIKGFPGYGPEKWTWFDAPSGDAEKLDTWNKQMTRNADAFGVRRGDFDPRSWNGKIGKVHIGKDKNGYMKVQWAIVEEAHDPNPPPVHTPAPQQSARQPAPAMADDFTDDIPF